MKSPIYLDYASTYPRHEDILRKRQEFEISDYANIWRGSYDLSEKSFLAYQQSKKTVADWIGCETLEVLYTYSATYACNLLALTLEYNDIIKKGDTILLSKSEHHANIVPWQMLAKKTWATVRFVGLDKNFCIDLHDLEEKLDDSVKVVSLQYASNVTGAIHSLEKVRDIIWPDRLFFIDAAQMVLHGPISMKYLGCDALVFSGHKIGADTGIWVLALKKELQKSWQSPISGWGAINTVSETWFLQAGIPERWEPGTPHITGAVTLDYALQDISSLTEIQKNTYQKMVQDTTEKFQKLQEKWLQLFHSNAENSLGIWSFTLPWKHVNDVGDILNSHHIFVRTGHHCCEPLHNSFWVSGTVRVSIWFDTASEEIDAFFSVLETLL